MKVARARVRCLVLACVVAAGRVLPAQEFPADKSRIAEAERADLSKLSDLERSYFAANKRYTVDIKALHFVPVSGATIAVSYASTRTFSASASHVRLAPFLCFVIVSSVGAGSPAENPFCTDSRYVAAAAVLARAGEEPEPPGAPASRGAARPPATVSATPVIVGGTEPSAAKPTGPSAGPVTVKDARYDPSRGVLEVAVERVPMPLAGPQPPDTGSMRPALACFTRPAFVCGVSGLTYIARDLLRVPRSRAPDPELLRSGLTLQARFAIGRRDDTPGPALTLLALLLQSKGEVVSRWEAAVIH